MSDEKQAENIRDAKGRFLPAAGRWKPGESGNPNGRPKRKTLTELLCAQLDEPCPHDKQGRTWGEVIVTATLTHGVKGQSASLQEVWNRSDGKITTLELSGPDGGPIQVDAIQKLDARITDIAKRRRKAKATQEPDPG